MTNYDITIHDELRIVQVTAHGNIDKQFIKDCISNARLSAEEKGHNLLYDFSDTFSSISIVDLYYLPREMNILNKPEARRIKIAELPGKPRNLWEFYDTVAKNLGFIHMLFDYEADAIKWLTD